MSSFADLFGPRKEAKVDSGVENLFSSAGAGPVTREHLRTSRTEIKIAEALEKSKQKQIEVRAGEAKKAEAAKKEESEEESSESSESEQEEEQTEAPKPKKKLSDKDDDLEARYYDKLLKDENKEKEPKVAEEKVDADSDDEDQEESSKKASKAKTIDLKESELEKAEKTVFVGNVISTVITSRQMAKTFKKLFSQFGKVDSIRYRSISFDEALPRKVAFAKKTLHKSRDTINAYVVFAEKEASRKSIKLNATVFEGFHIRVDHVAHPAPKDNRRTIFVGNLDFEEKEETLWRYFNSKIDNDVESVRVIRDAKTNVGKGFALVSFKDSLSVNRALLLNDKAMTETKGRKLRISRAKSYAKPSILSPNHFDNTKKAFAAKKSKLSEDQKTKFGRAQTILGRADRSTVGKSKIVEGQRASKGARIAGIKGLKTGGKVKKPRIRERSSKFKQERDQISKELKK